MIVAHAYLVNTQDQVGLLEFAIRRQQLKDGLEEGHRIHGGHREAVTGFAVGRGGIATIKGEAHAVLANDGGLGDEHVQLPNVKGLGHIAALAERVQLNKPDWMNRVSFLR